MSESTDITRQRYTAVAIVLHWAIAIAMLGQIALGLWMHEAIEDGATRAHAVAAFQLHKSIGLTVLALSIARLFWRLSHRPPPYPAHMPHWERLIARISHWAFYGLIILLPLTGWLYVSTGWSATEDHELNVPTLFFGLFRVPHLFGLDHAAEAIRAQLAGTFLFAHYWLAWSAVGLVVLHVGAALKHHFFDQDEVLTHMIPGLKPLAARPAPAPPAPARMPILIAGFALIAIATIAAVSAFLSPPRAAPAQPEAAIEESAVAPSEIAPAPSTEETPLTPGGQPPVWRVARAASAIQFSGTHDGTRFTGRFSSWRADIRFDPANLDASSAVVTIDTASASDGIPLHDESLPGAEWFDSARHPTAVFRTTRIRDRSDGSYEARGVLTIKGRPIDVDLPFTLTVSGDRAVMEGRIAIDRREADLGQASDPDAEYVSREIDVVVHVEATRAP